MMVRVPGTLLASSLRLCVLPAIWLWAVESLRLLSRSERVPGLSQAQGLFAALGLSVLLAGLLGVALWALRFLSSQRVGNDAVVPWSARLSEFLWEGDERIQSARVATLLGAALLLVGYARAAYAVVHALLLEIAQPHFEALAVIGAHVALLVLALLLFPAARAVGVLLTRVFAQVRGLRWLMARAGRAVVFGGLLALVAASIALVKFWPTLMFLPWDMIAGVAAAIVLAAAWQVLLVPLKRSIVIERSLAIPLAVLAAVALVTLDAKNAESKRSLYATLGGTYGHAAASFALDFDRDGHLSVLGGGDCAPFDRRISPVAIDVPNNRIDEDCDGADLDGKRLGIELRRNWPVPSSFPKRPPVVLITIDAFAADRMQALGARRVVTPVLDAFAKRSTLFRSAFTQGPSTRLAFPALFTSRWDSQIKQHLEGSHPYPIDPSEVLLAEALNREGYDTTAVISDAYFGKRRWPSITGGFKDVIESPVRVGAGKHNSVQVTDAALQAWLRVRKRPLFLWVHYYDAHPPHTQPASVKGFGAARSDIYDAELQLVDREVGRLLAELERAPQAPLIFVTGDHGIAFDKPRHGRLNYGYDLSSVVLHVPLIVHGPGIGAQVLEGLVSTMDIAPTIANLVRSKRSLPFEGASLVPELFEGKLSRPQRVLHEFFLLERKWTNADPLEQISLRTDRYNLIHDRKRGTYELYDWRKDYLETRNLSDEPAHKSALAGLRQQLALMTYRVHESTRVPPVETAKSVVAAH